MIKFIKKLSKNKIRFYSSLFLTIMVLFANIYLGYAISLLSGIETVLRVSVFIISMIIFSLFMLFSIKHIMENSIPKFITLMIFKIIYIVIIFIVSFNVNIIYNKLSGIGSKTTLYTSSLITTKENEISDYKNITTGKIGVLSNETSIEGKIIPEEFLSKESINNEQVVYESFIDMLEGLENGEILYAFVPGNYLMMFSEIDTISSFLNKTKVIYNIEKEISSVGTKRDLSKPFSVLIMGVDSENENIKGSSFNGDALMVLTFNPQTLNTTILSIPRDTYVPIACFAGDRNNKITHAAWYGENCMIDTIEGFLDINIDYFLKINFKGVVKLVDALGGVDVDVPYSFCEQNSNRQWGTNTIYVKKGLQTLTGEQALALSRNRHPNPDHCSSKWTNYNSNDFIRGQNQQLVISAMMEKMKNVRSVDTLYDLLDGISNSMETNMSTEEMLSFYNIGKDILNMSKEEKVTDILNFQRLYISGYDQYIFDYSQIQNQGTKSNLYNFVPYKGSLEDVSSYMKANLGTDESKIIKTVSFDINTPYEEKVIGKGYYNESRMVLLPNFTGSSETTVKEFANKYNLPVEVTKVTKTGNYTVGQVLSQFPYAKMDINFVNKIKIEVVEKVEIPTTPTTPLDCYLEENENETSCQLPSFEGVSYANFLNKKSAYKVNFEITMIETTSEDYDATKAGLITSQDIKNVSLYSVKDQTIKITYMQEEREE